MNLYEKYRAKAKVNGRELHDVMFSEYKKYISKATKDQTVEYLQELQPARLQIIRNTMQQLDHYFNKRDYQNFMKTIEASLKDLEQDIY